MRSLRAFTISAAALAVVLSTTARADTAPQQQPRDTASPNLRSGRWGMTRGEKLYTRGQVKGELAGKQFSQAKGMFLAAIVSRFKQVRSLLSRDPEIRAQAAEHGAVASRGRRWGWRYLKQSIKSKVTAPFDRLRGKVALSTERIRGALFSLSQGLSPATDSAGASRETPAAGPTGGRQMSVRAQLTTGLRAGTPDPNAAAAFIMGEGVTLGRGSALSRQDAGLLADAMQAQVQQTQTRWGARTLRAGSRVVFKGGGTGIVLDAGNSATGNARRDPLLAVVQEGRGAQAGTLVLDAVNVPVSEFSKVYSRKQRTGARQPPAAKPRRAAPERLLRQLGGGSDLRAALASFVGAGQGALRPRDMIGVMSGLGADRAALVGSGLWGARGNRTPVRMGDRVTVHVSEMLGDKPAAAQYTGVVLDAGSRKRGTPALVGTFDAQGRFSTMQFSPDAVTSVTVSATAGKRAAGMVQPYLPGLEP